ncbi:DegT/DnrJ/EryC1/StrS family aminotransferase [Acidithiobacillus sp. CV18-2]|uniref:DegT/DnrJ/EryC1/StrS family aminotransferase n=1 Tax=Igneacidithiobacillus copahuensis TaxID=2724909 RepID=A0AAE2YQS3_9PROT|nr:DegT/DnrJ/EryC1/StrS family aminotransferase [Igneacidithiobacillus copahuensis]MBU2753508.1 DegT/DnrJ/EryC1/StrS family aminotransferase [Acidithiobacillus sp. CV18-3]MBU2757126.1 DegT/DnrJ/EryC1/StrS family aminotransferase [Acidithiobacillus sp. BN09-2]MBU2776002.1 DegT/DnrJ/EryC1/StrS family aminotransferase [Acidithiobacillus sp. CV18-2]MBU2795893.1 DegT/DnrJ/EryC1/StrS family aminotransferase [Acidithiobacillus sp. VAN18-2]MBU2800321.1 DegT/DnrJ/EryC1/StrS family aminotransferase [Aci
MEQQIPMVDLRAHFAPLREEILAGIGEILDQAGFILGAHGRGLEAELAQYLGVAHGVGCASGTDALLLALRALDIGPGDEVIVPTFTFIATAEAVRYVGATPVFADVDPDYFCVTAAGIAPLITPRTRAIIPVHLYGQAAPMPELLQLAEQHGILVIEDMAQAIGARLHGQRVGSFAQLACVSFFPSKNLGGAGDGGMVFTNDEALATRLRGLRNHGSWRTYEHEVLGYNSRLDEIQALILRKLFQRIDAYNAGRQQAASLYDAALQDLPLQIPARRAGAEHVFHQYTLQIADRDALRTRLHAEGIACGVYYPIPCHQQQAFADLPPSHCPVAESLKDRVLSLPMFPELSAAQVERIAGVIRAHLHGE